LRRKIRRTPQCKSLHLQTRLLTKKNAGWEAIFHIYSLKMKRIELKSFNNAKSTWMRCVMRLWRKTSSKGWFLIELVKIPRTRIKPILSLALQTLRIQIFFAVSFYWLTPYLATWRVYCIPKVVATEFISMNSWKRNYKIIILCRLLINIFFVKSMHACVCKFNFTWKASGGGPAWSMTIVAVSLSSTGNFALRARTYKRCKVEMDRYKNIQNELYLIINNQGQKSWYKLCNEIRPHFNFRKFLKNIFCFYHQISESFSVVKALPEHLS